MNCATKSKSKRQELIFPGFGNMVNELMNTPLHEVIKEEPKRFTYPAANILETADGYKISLAIPGFDKKDLNIDVDKHILKVSVNTSETSDKKYRLREFNYNEAKRSFRLPKTIDLESISAKVDNGILNISLMKLETQKARTIEVK